MTDTTRGTMIWKDTRIPVRDVEEGPRMSADGVRDGWDATTDDVIGARMFYPADMFTFEPEAASLTSPLPTDEDAPALTDMVAAAREFADGLDVTRADLGNARIHIFRLADALEATNHTDRSGDE